MSKTNIYYVTFKGVTRNKKGFGFASIENTIVYAENIEDAIKTLKDFWNNAKSDPFWTKSMNEPEESYEILKIEKGDFYAV